MRVTLLTPSPAALPPCAATLYQPHRFRRIEAAHGEEVLAAHLQQLRQAWAALPTLPAPLQETELYAFARTGADLPALESSFRLLHSHNLPIQDAPDAGGCPFPVERSLRVPALTADADALSAALLRSIRHHGGRIHTDRVLNASAQHVFTADGRVDAAHVLLCTGKPLGLTGRLLSLMETRTVACSRLDAPVPLHTLQASADGRTLLIPGAGGVHALCDAGRTGTSAESTGSAAFTRFLQRHMPEWPARSVQYRPIAFPADGLPIVGRFRAGILAAAGAEDFLNAMLCALGLARLTLHQPAAADLLLRPDRFIPRALMRRCSLTRRKARAVAALRPSAPRCSHCRCRLRWHGAARWWGCAGCGAVFTLLGQPMGAPALQQAVVSARQRPGW